jgi:hypothetical protein
MAEYTPAYELAAPLTVEHLDARIEELEGIHAYALEHDDVMALDELFCRIVALEHRIIRWEHEEDLGARVETSLKELNRALKWAWLARDEEDHTGGMYGTKLKEANAVLRDLAVYLETTRRRIAEPAAPRPDGMTQQGAETLAEVIKRRLPQAEVEVRAEPGGRSWVVEARNPRRGTVMVFRSPEEFKALMDRAVRS